MMVIVVMYGVEEIFFARLVPLSFKWLGLGLCLVCSFKYVLVEYLSFAYGLFLLGPLW